jgi:hypothetical protein
LKYLVVRKLGEAFPGDSVGWIEAQWEVLTVQQALVDRNHLRTFSGETTARHLIGYALPYLGSGTRTKKHLL